MLTLTLIRSNAKKAAKRDGYDQDISQDKDTGEYGFIRHYPNNLSPWEEYVETVKAE
jgi:hypothetical protein